MVQRALMARTDTEDRTMTKEQPQNQQPPQPPQRPQSQQQKPPQGSAMVKAKNEQYQNMQHYLMSQETRISNLFSKNSPLDAKRMIRITLGMFSRQPDLLECTPQSMLLALMDAAHFNLEPNPVLGHAFVVPYWNKKREQKEAQFQAGYKGLIVLAHRSGLILDLDAVVVHEKDKFRIQRHRTPQFVHEPAFVADPGSAIGAYATALLRNGHQKFLPLTVAEIQRFRKRGQDREGGPWVTDWDAMAKKTCIRRLTSLLPLEANHDLARVVAGERETEIQGHVVYMNPGAAEVEAEGVARMPTASRGDELAERLGRRTGAGGGKDKKVIDATAGDPTESDSAAPPDAVHGQDEPGF